MVDVNTPTVWAPTQPITADREVPPPSRDSSTLPPLPLHPSGSNSNSPGYRGFTSALLPGYCSQLEKPWNPGGKLLSGSRYLLTSHPPSIPFYLFLPSSSFHSITSASSLQWGVQLRQQPTLLVRLSGSSSVTLPRTLSSSPSNPISKREVAHELEQGTLGTAPGNTRCLLNPPSCITASPRVRLTLRNAHSTRARAGTKGGPRRLSEPPVALAGNDSPFFRVPLSPVGSLGSIQFIYRGLKYGGTDAPLTIHVTE